MCDGSPFTVGSQYVITYDDAMDNLHFCGRYVGQVKIGKFRFLEDDGPYLDIEMSRIKEWRPYADPV